MIVVNNSLRRKINKKIKEKHPSLFNSGWHDFRKRCSNFIFHRKRWWLVVALVITVFFLGGVINFGENNIICIPKKTAEVLVDQRTSNVATIISITLVVIGFLINNLGIKSQVTYNLLFKKSYLYSTMYLTLSTIGCFITMSTLRDVENPFITFNFSQGVIAGSILVIMILFFIGFLFRVLIRFTSVKEIRKMLHQELISEAKEKRKKQLLEKYSLGQFAKDVVESGGKEYTIIDQLNSAVFDAEFELDVYKIATQKERLIVDIKMNRLKRIIKRKRKKSETVYFKRLGLNQISTELDSFIWGDVKNSFFDKFCLKSCLRLRKVPKLETDDYKRYFEQQVEECTESNKFRDLEIFLDSYVELYKLEIENQDE